MNTTIADPIWEVKTKECTVICINPNQPYDRSPVEYDYENIQNLSSIGAEMYLTNEDGIFLFTNGENGDWKKVEKIPKYS